MTTPLFSSPSSDPIELNPLVSTVKPSATVEVFSLVKKMQSEGIEVTSLCVGEPDFPPPKPVLDAVLAAVADGQTRYTAVTGTAPLRRAIADDLRERKGTTYDPDTEIVVGNGAKQCVYQGVLAVCGVGDIAIVPAPYWPSYPEMVALAGSQCVILPTREEDGYLITPEALRSCLEEHKEKAKLLILCNPALATLTNAVSVVMSFCGHSSGGQELLKNKSAAEIAEHLVKRADRMMEEVDPSSKGPGASESLIGVLLRSIRRSHNKCPNATLACMCLRYLCRTSSAIRGRVQLTEKSMDHIKKAIKVGKECHQQLYVESMELFRAMAGQSYISG